MTIKQIKTQRICEIIHTPNCIRIDLYCMSKANTICGYGPHYCKLLILWKNRGDLLCQLKCNQNQWLSEKSNEIRRSENNRKSSWRTIHARNCLVSSLIESDPNLVEVYAHWQFDTNWQLCDCFYEDSFNFSLIAKQQKVPIFSVPMRSYEAMRRSNFGNDYDNSIISLQIVVTIHLASSVCFAIE